MKSNVIRFGLSLLLVSVIASAVAANGWHYVAAPNGYYWRVNANNVHDGYWYTNYNGCYSQYSKIPVVQQQAQTAVRYSEHWKVDLVRAINQQKDNELFLEAVRESGLQPKGGVYNGVSTQFVNGNGYLRGTSVYTTGYPYAQQGSTFYGLAAYAPNIGQVNIEGVLAQQTRLATQLNDVAGQVNLAFNDRIQQVGSAQLELAKIQEAGRVAVATLQASQPPKSITHQWESGASQGQSLGGDRGMTPRGNAAVPRPAVPKNSALLRIRSEQLFQQRCGNCHGPQKAEKGLNLTDFSTWSQETLDHYGPLIADRVTTDDETKMMPPPGKGDPLNAQELRLILPGLPDNAPEGN